jgi:phytoene/squalene synthetase
MMMQSDFSDHLARSITRAGSRQTYLTIRWLVDRDLVAEAYRAYAYFRWVDDVIDETLLTREQRLAFVVHQKGLVERLLRGEVPESLAPEEEMLSALARGERKRHGGLASYLQNMMAVMEFDARRRGRLVSAAEIDAYTRLLSKAVMDGLTYFIGHRYRYPDSAPRYSAVAGAHVTHMLRDAVEDAEAGYFNIPREVLEAGRIAPRDFDSPPYRAWVRERVRLARGLFREGKQYIRRLGNLRARIAGLAYCARFEPVLDAIEASGSLLRPVGEPPEPSGARSGEVGSRHSQRSVR